MTIPTIAQNAPYVWAVLGASNVGIPTIAQNAPYVWALSADANGNAITENYFFNVKDYRAVGNGSTDDTTAIALAISACVAAGGGIVFFPAGTYKISTQISLSSANVVLMGAGGQATILQPSASFLGSQIVLITADFCGVRDLTIAYANTTTSSNPAADGIRITGCRSGTIFNVYANYINGWAFHSTATASVANYWWQFINANAFQCTNGIRIVGNSSSGYNMAHSLTNCIMDQVTGGDAYQIADAHDVLIVNAEGSPLSGSGATMHITGDSKAVYVVNGDLGPAPGPATGPTILIDAGATNPQQISFVNTIIEGGSIGVTISAGNQIMFRNCDILRSGTHGVSLSGTATTIMISGCLFDQNGATAGAGHYDINSSSSGNITLETCWFTTPQGTGANQVADVINNTAGSMSVQNCAFTGTGFTSSNIFNGFPSIIRNCKGYNPVGNVSVSVPSSNTNFATKSTDMTYFVTGGTVTAIKIGGVATGLTAGAFRVPAQQTFSITYSVVPAVTGFSD